MILSSVSYLHYYLYYFTNIYRFSTVLWKEGIRIYIVFHDYYNHQLKV